MGALSAAWELSRGAWRTRFDSITVYQRGARLGGKAASTRGVHGRIEEHGLHVWMGYYDNAFRLVRECYDELDRQRTDPACPIASFGDAFEPGVRLGVADDAGGSSYWLADLAANDLLPGDPSPPTSAEDMVPKLIAAAGAALRSIRSPPARRGLVLSASPDRPLARSEPSAWADEVVRLTADLEAGAIGAIGATLARLGSMAGGQGAELLAPSLRALRAFVHDRLASDRHARRAADVVELLLVIAGGIATDRLSDDRERWRQADRESAGHWLMRHGARPALVDGPTMRGFHDLVFGYVDGDGMRPNFPAGLGLQLLRRLFFDYKGALCWRMRAGMGDVVIAPLYQALRQRGVRFEFFHDIEALRLSSDRSTIDRIELTVQAATKHGREFDPLVRVGGVPAFPSQHDASQLIGDARGPSRLLETKWYDPREGRARTLRRGQDFDVVLLGISAGALGSCATDLIRANEAFRAMSTGLSTVATQAFQVWLSRSEAELGWGNGGAIVAGGGTPFDTYASMTHLLPFEQWPAWQRPEGLAYLCSAIPESSSVPRSLADHAMATDRVRAAAVHYLAGRARAHWPNAFELSGFDWDALSASPDRVGPERFMAQFWTANVDPSDRYVQATPESSGLRLPPDRSGFANLLLVGDWTDCGLNAGCIEAAVLSGVQAAAALRNDESGSRELGGWRTAAGGGEST